MRNQKQIISQNQTPVLLLQSEKYFLVFGTELLHFSKDKIELLY